MPARHNVPGIDKRQDKHRSPHGRLVIDGLLPLSCHEHPGSSSRPNLWPPFKTREQPRCHPSHLCAFVLKAFDQAYDKARDEEWLNLNVGC